MSAGEPAKIVVARHGSPVLLGIGEDEFFVASDASAVLAHTRSVVYLDDGDIAVLTADRYHVMDAQAHVRSEEHTSELQSRLHLVCRLLLEKKKKENNHQANRTKELLRQHN